MTILIIGGTRNIGYRLLHRLLDEGHRVTIFNRGKTYVELPAGVERLLGDRTDSEQLRVALGGRTFDAVIDTTLYKGAEAEAIVPLLRGRVGHYVFISTGQVYLVREGAPRPTRESDYAGRLMPPPKPNTFGHEEWVYGYEKRRAEDAFADAWANGGFPYTSLRLPMVNSEFDHFQRLYNYVLRITDGGPVLAPSTPNYALRHVYSGDVVEAIMRVIGGGLGKGKAYNIAQDETFGLFDFLEVLGDLLGVPARAVSIRRDILEAHGFLPDCSPFSERWMSELDNSASKADLGMVYTPARDYLARILAHYAAHPPTPPASYRRRRAEKLLIDQLDQSGDWRD